MPWSVEEIAIFLPPFFDFLHLILCDLGKSENLYRAHPVRNDKVTHVKNWEENRILALGQTGRWQVKKTFNKNYVAAKLNKHFNFPH